MKKTIVIIIAIAITITIIPSYLIFRIGQFDSKLAIEHQLKQIIQAHDEKRIVSLSLDNPTKEYLLHLPKVIDVHGTTDFQGGTNEIGYYVTAIGNKPLSVYMKRDTQSLFHKLFPKWTLFKLTIAPNGILPDIHELLEDDMFD